MYDTARREGSNPRVEEVLSYGRNGGSTTARIRSCFGGALLKLISSETLEYKDLIGSQGHS